MASMRTTAQAASMNADGLQSSAGGFDGVELVAAMRTQDTLLDSDDRVRGRRGESSRRQDRLATMVMVNLASVLEKTDEQLLPSVYKYVACSFRARPEQLGYITSARAVCQALASGLGGYLGHHNDRSQVIAAGCFIWGAMTLAFSFVSSWQWGAMTWAWNGVGLSFVIPNTQSLVADYFSDTDRGKAFGTLYTTGALGGMLGTAYATNMAGLDLFGTDGWRTAFRAIGVVALSIGLATLKFAVDPHHRKASSELLAKRADKGFKSTMLDFLAVVRVPTFQVIIVQGILGSTPWNALVFMTMYLQLLGFSDFNASLVLSLFLAGAALGGVLGGAVGDWAARRSRNHGRILACQFSVSMGIPFSLIVMKGLPRDGEAATVALYAVVMFIFGLMHVWAAPACNNPVFAEIVPEELRNLVYAFDRSFEGALAALGAPLVGLVAERVFLFPTDGASYPCAGGKPIDGGIDKAMQASRVDALGNAMLVCMLVPWTLCLVIYTALHWTYPRDRKAAAASEQYEPACVHDDDEEDDGNGCESAPMV